MRTTSDAPWSRPARILGTTAVLGSVLLLGFGVPRTQGAAQQGTLPWKPAAGTEGQYIGSENCLICHDTMGEAFAANPHASATAAAGLDVGDVTCEACHGPGQEHMDAGGDPDLIPRKFGTLPAGQVDATCLTCHAGSKKHAFAATSSHAAGAVSCTECHSVHHAQVGNLLQQKTPELCFTCHASVQTDFAAADGHKVKEGLVSCESCHNPHGSANEPMLARTMVDGELCKTCHIDKRGPFVFEHPANSVEGCVACHTPHGSQNRFMLKMNTTRELCLSCHIAVPTFHDLSNPRYNLCTTCHAAIHGSDTHHLFFRR